MKQRKKNKTRPDLTRRDFLRSGSVATVMALMGGVPIRAEDKTKPAASEAPAKPSVAAPVNCAVVGCGVWGRELLKTLALQPNAPVVAICDTYEAFMRRSKESAPNAGTFADYKQVLANKDVQAVFVATPSHQHKQIVLDALRAGKHVYCEAPLASTVEDARAIAQAAKGATRVNFQAGLQMRSDPQRHFLLQFIRAGALGKTVMGRAQWHKKTSWRRTAPTAEREKEINWRLSQATSAGLMGEIGVHQVDMANLFILSRPVSVTGFGGVLQWNDGRDVADTIQTVFEYPSGVHLTYDCTLANSFDGEYEMFYGTDSAVMIRENKAWMFKEVDAPLLGWEVYARKDSFYKETGIALVANATKLAAQGVKVSEDTVAPNDTPLYHALESFVTNCGLVSTAVQDFIDNFGENEKGLRDYVANIGKNKMPAAGYQDGYEATVTAIKANEAVIKRQKVTFQKEWFELS